MMYVVVINIGIFNTLLSIMWEIVFEPDSIQISPKKNYIYSEEPTLKLGMDRISGLCGRTPDRWLQ